MVIEVDGNKTEECPRKSWWFDVQDDMKNFGLHRTILGHNK